MKPTQMFQSLQHMMRLISWLKTEKDSPKKKKRQTMNILDSTKKKKSEESSQKRQTSKNKRGRQNIETTQKHIDKMPCLPASRPLYTENISSKWKNLP